MLRTLMRGLALPIAATALIVSGCGSTVVQIPTLAATPEYNFEVDTYRIHTTLDEKHYAQPYPLNLTCFHAVSTAGKPALAPRGEPPKGCDSSLYFQLKGVLTPKEQRNVIQNELMRRSDQTCSYYMTRMMYGQFMGSAGASIVNSVGAAFKSVTKTVNDFGEALITTATPGITNIDVLKWKVYSDTAMKIKRGRARLRNKMRDAQRMEIEVYEISQAVYDTQRYHDLCNIATIIADTSFTDADYEELVYVAASAPTRDKPKDK